MEKYLILITIVSLTGLALYTDWYLRRKFKKK